MACLAYILLKWYSQNLCGFMYFIYISNFKVLEQITRKIEMFFFFFLSLPNFEKAFFWAPPPSNDPIDESGYLRFCVAPIYKVSSNSEKWCRSYCVRNRQTHYLQNQEVKTLTSLCAVDDNFVVSLRFFHSKPSLKQKTHQTKKMKYLCTRE